MIYPVTRFDVAFVVGMVALMLPPYLVVALVIVALAFIGHLVRRDTGARRRAQPEPPESLTA